MIFERLWSPNNGVQIFRFVRVKSDKSKDLDSVLLWFFACGGLWAARVGVGFDGGVSTDYCGFGGVDAGE